MIERSYGRQWAEIEDGVYRFHVSVEKMHSSTPRVVKCLNFGFLRNAGNKSLVQDPTESCIKCNGYSVLECLCISFVLWWLIIFVIVECADAAVLVHRSVHFSFESEKYSFGELPAWNQWQVRKHMLTHFQSHVQSFRRESLFIMQNKPGNAHDYRPSIRIHLDWGRV